MIFLIRQEFGDDDDDGPASLGTDNSDSLSELRAMRGKKEFKHFGQDEDDDDDDDDDDDFDKDSDLWEINSYYE